MQFHTVSSLTDMESGSRAAELTFVVIDRVSEIPFHRLTLPGRAVNVIEISPGGPESGRSDGQERRQE